MIEAPQLRLVLPARSENLIVVRQAVAGLAELAGLSEERLADLKTVVTEACNNVVLHAYEGRVGPLEVIVGVNERGVEVEVADEGEGFRPRADGAAGASLGLGLPLIAALSDAFAISGRAGEGTRIRLEISSLRARERLEAPDSSRAPTESEERAAVSNETAIAVASGEAARPVLARVIAALAARADFSIDRLADTVLLGDAVSSHRAADFAEGRVGISIRDSEGALEVRVGPLIAGGGERILAGMDFPAGTQGSLRQLARSMRVTHAKSPDGQAAEYLELEVAR